MSRGSAEQEAGEAGRAGPARAPPSVSAPAMQAQCPARAPVPLLGSLRASLSQGDADRLVLRAVRGGFLEEVAAEPLRRKGCSPTEGMGSPSFRGIV